jgi:hypothetical protein
MQKRVWVYTNPEDKDFVEHKSRKALLDYVCKTDSISMDGYQCCVSLWIAVVEGLPHDYNLGGEGSFPKWYSFLIGYLLEEEKTTLDPMPPLARYYINEHMHLTVIKDALTAGRVAYHRNQ